MRERSVSGDFALSSNEAIWEVGQKGHQGWGRWRGYRPPLLLQVAVKVACHPAEEDLWARHSESIDKVVIVASAVLGRSGLSVRGSR